MRLILVRHGETEKNRLRKTGGRDVPLNPTGQKQAEALARRLSTEKIHHVYSSDLQRARQTTVIISAQQPGVPVTFTSELRERNHGELAEQSVSEREKIQKNSGKDIRDWRPEGGESLRDVKHRAERWLAKHREENADATVLIVSHGLFIYALLEVAIEDGADVEREDFLLGNCSLTILDVPPDGRSRIIHLNDKTHLG